MTPLALDSTPPWPAAAPPPATLAQCVLLALLLHVLTVLLLGSAPGGTARRGEGVWGAINITLSGPARVSITAEVSPPPPEQQAGPPGTAPQVRHGGAVRETPSVPQPTEPGAAQRGQWAPLPTPAANPEPAPSAELLSAPEAKPVTVTPEVDRTVVERRLGSTLQREPVRPAPTAPLASTVQPTPPLRGLGGLPPLADLPAPLPAPPLAAPAVVAPPVSVPAAVATPSPPLPEPVATIRRDDLPRPSAPVSPLSRLPQAASVSPLPPMPATPRGLAPAAAALPDGGAAMAAPDAGPHVGHDVATPPSAPASAPLRLNLELPRMSGGELSRHSAPGVLQLLPRPPELPPKLARDIEKAAKDDCRTAYGGAGVLAVVPLLVDAVRKDGCKW